MTDVRERVARAIWEARHGCELNRQMTINEASTYVPMAKAALSAIGYEEIVGALEMLYTAHRMMLIEDGLKETVIDKWPVLENAVAALRKARGEP